MRILGYLYVTPNRVYFLCPGAALWRLGSSMEVTG